LRIYINSYRLTSGKTVNKQEVKNWKVVWKN